MKPTLRPVTQFTLFLSLPAIPNILRAFPPPRPSRASAIQEFLVINMFCVFLRAHFNPLLETG